MHDDERRAVLPEKRREIDIGAKDRRHENERREPGRKEAPGAPLFDDESLEEHQICRKCECADGDAGHEEHDHVREEPRDERVERVDEHDERIVEHADPFDRNAEEFREAARRHDVTVAVQRADHRLGSFLFDKNVKRDRKAGEGENDRPQVEEKLMEYGHGKYCSIF